MKKRFQIVIKDKTKESIYYIEKRMTVLELISRIRPVSEKNIVAAIINNRLCDLSEYIENNSLVEFIYLNTEKGLEIYRDTATHILAYAIKRIFGKDILRIGPSISYNYYFDLENGIKIDKKLLKKIEVEMWNIIRKDIPLKMEILTAQEGINFYKRKNEPNKASLIKTSRLETVKFYAIENFKELCNGPLAPSTGVITKFKLVQYPPGFLLVFPELYNNRLIIKQKKTPKKLSKVFLEARDWYKEQGVSNVAHLNQLILDNKLSELITISEALHEKRIAQIADIITKKRNELKIILIAGPSASGKTTFSKRLSIHLKVNGIKPVSISLDNYFVNRDKTPKDEQGIYDFECLEALDIKLLNNHLNELLKGKKIMMPLYDFYKGKRKEERVPLKLEKDQIIIIEGIHGLNEELTSKISKKNKYKIYVSALTQLRLSSYHRITTTDTRLLRRIVRDSLFRNHTAQDTLRMWHSVRRGEERYIFPFQEDADIIFNSALIYEFAVIKTYVYRYLLDVSHQSPEYAEARRLLEILDFFVDAGSKDVPKTSILREFIGGSNFKY